MISPPPVASTTPLASGQAEASSETAVVSQPRDGEQTAILPTQTLGLDSVVASPPRPDYAWLAETILRRMEGLKKYPAEARLDSAEGKVILKAVIRSDGHVENVEIFQSSGHQSLDHAAVELLNLAAPFQFPRPMDRPQMTLKIPMRYRLE
jgi:protein TonB